jgi:hypothetical protein
VPPTAGQIAAIFEVDLPAGLADELGLSSWFDDLEG